MYKYLLGMLLALPIGISCMEENPRQEQQEQTQDGDEQDLILKLSSLSTDTKSPAEIKKDFTDIKTGATQFSDVNLEIGALSLLYTQAENLGEQRLAHSIAAYRGKKKLRQQRQNRRPRKTLQERVDDNDKRFV